VFGRGCGRGGVYTVGNEYVTVDTTLLKVVGSRGDYTSDSRRIVSACGKIPPLCEGFPAFTTPRLRYQSSNVCTFSFEFRVE